MASTCLLSRSEDPCRRPISVDIDLPTASRVLSPWPITRRSVGRDARQRWECPMADGGMNRLSRSYTASKFDCLASFWRFEGEPNPKSGTSAEDSIQGRASKGAGGTQRARVRPGDTGGAPRCPHPAYNGRQPPHPLAQSSRLTPRVGCSMSAFIIRFSRNARYCVGKYSSATRTPKCALRRVPQTRRSRDVRKGRRRGAQ